jgi:hypothetical protein
MHFLATGDESFGGFENKTILLRFCDDFKNVTKIVGNSPPENFRLGVLQNLLNLAWLKYVLNQRHHPKHLKS